MSPGSRAYENALQDLVQTRQEKNEARTENARLQARVAELEVALRNEQRAHADLRRTLNTDEVKALAAVRLAQAVLAKADAPPLVVMDDWCAKQDAALVALREAFGEGP